MVIITEVGETLDRVDSVGAEEGTQFQKEIDRELKVAKSGLVNAICLRLGEIALENCPPQKEP